MNAIEYFKVYGLSEAKRILNDAQGCASVRLYGKYEFSADDLKQIVDAWELVESYGGIESCKNKLYMLHELAENPEPIRDAINLVEQCQ